MLEKLKQKVGPLPLGVWVVIATAIVVVLLFRNKSASTSASGAAFYPTQGDAAGGGSPKPLDTSSTAPVASDAASGGGTQAGNTNQLPIYFTPQPDVNAPTYANPAGGGVAAPTKTGGVGDVTGGDTNFYFKASPSGAIGVLPQGSVVTPAYALGGEGNTPIKLSDWAIAHGYSGTTI